MRLTNTAPLKELGLWLEEVFITVVMAAAMIHR